LWRVGVAGQVDLVTARPVVSVLVGLSQPVAGGRWRVEPFLHYTLDQSPSADGRLLIRPWQIGLAWRTN
jgi:hypothetical protein